MKYRPEYIKLAAVMTLKKLNILGAADFLGDTVPAVRGMVARKQLPFHKLGGKIFFIQSELEEYLVKLPGVTVREALERCAERREE